MKGRVAGAPISWGVCEVPGWGYQLPADRVLAEMAALGLTATEFGPAGYLPTDPVQRSRLLAGHGLSAAGGFVPVVLHAPGAAEAVDRALEKGQEFSGRKLAQETSMTCRRAAACR